MEGEGVLRERGHSLGAGEVLGTGLVFPSAVAVRGDLAEPTAWTMALTR